MYILCTHGTYIHTYTRAHVCIHTIYAYTQVYIIRAIFGEIPLTNNAHAEISTSAMEEERRLFYVAMTRAKENLFITYVTQLRYVCVYMCVYVCMYVFLVDMTRTEDHLYVTYTRTTYTLHTQGQPIRYIHKDNLYVTYTRTTYTLHTQGPSIRYIHKDNLYVTYTRTTYTLHTQGPSIRYIHKGPCVSPSNFITGIHTHTHTYIHTHTYTHVSHSVSPSNFITEIHTHTYIYTEGNVCLPRISSQRFLEH
jgi:superfamily I DNA/RNA helicase